MESNRVTELRQEFGILDSRNEYTESELIELSKKKLYYIHPNYENMNEGVKIEYKQVLGYVSSDEKSAIFIKDIDVTGRNNKYYYPVKLVKHCTLIKDGIYHAEADDTIFCTTDELNFCLEYEQNYVNKKIQDKIQDLERQISRLKKMGKVIRR